MYNVNYLNYHDFSTHRTPLCKTLPVVGYQNFAHILLFLIVRGDLIKFSRHVWAKLKGRESNKFGCDRRDACTRRDNDQRHRWICPATMCHVSKSRKAAYDTNT